MWMTGKKNEDWNAKEKEEREKEMLKKKMKKIPMMKKMPLKTNQTLLAAKPCVVLTD